MKKFSAVIGILSDARDKISKLLSAHEDDNFRIAITHRLQMDIDKLALLHGISVDDTPVKPMGAATTIAGKPIEHVKKVSLKDTEPDDDSVKILKAYVNEMYASFLKTDTVEILKTADPLVVRGVAKKAGMNKVTKDNPEKITIEFIDEIKALIKAK